MKKFFSLFILFFCLNANSHEFNPAHLIINQSNSNLNNYDATWMYPVKNIGKRANVIFPGICEPISSDPFVQGKYIIEKITLDCNESIKGKTIEIENLSVLTDAMITINFDKVTKESIYASIDTTNMLVKKDLSKDYNLLKHKLGRKPMMMDFIKHGDGRAYYSCSLG